MVFFWNACALSGKHYVELDQKRSDSFCGHVYSIDIWKKKVWSRAWELEDVLIGIFNSEFIGVWIFYVLPGK